MKLTHVFVALFASLVLSVQLSLAKSQNDYGIMVRSTYFVSTTCLETIEIGKIHTIN